MTYIENIFVCIAAPLLVAALCMGRRYLHFFIFAFAGMGACLIASYLNTFFAALYGATAFNATAEIAPVVEEVTKFLPLLFYLLVFEPAAEKILPAVITLAASFATFENICYLIEHGAERVGFLLIRGFGTGAMHIVCGAIFHGTYNLLIAYGSWVQYIAYALPLAALALGMIVSRALPRERKIE